MDWIKKFDLFLFDLDGLLVDTEVIHFAAFKELCRENGIDLTWDMDRYVREAHYQSQGIKEAIYREFPHFKEQHPDWGSWYAGKRQIYNQMLREREIGMMPGAQSLLRALEEADIRRAVVTNSSKDQTTIIREKVPVLNSIPLWITREDYHVAKPSPEGYLKAIAILGEPGDRIVGFEDSPRGIKALEAAEVQAVLICGDGHPFLKEKKRLHFTSLEKINNSL